MDSIGQIEGSFPWLNRGQIYFCPHIRRLQLVNDAFWPSDSHVRFGKAGGIDLHIIGKILELDWNSHFDFCDGIARHAQPQPDGEGQGNQLKSDIVNEDTMHQGRHGHSSLPGRTLASCRRENELGGSSSTKLSSAGLGSEGAGA